MSLAAATSSRCQPLVGPEALRLRLALSFVQRNAGRAETEHRARADGVQLQAGCGGGGGGNAGAAAAPHSQRCLVTRALYHKHNPFDFSSSMDPSDMNSATPSSTVDSIDDAEEQQ